MPITPDEADTLYQQRLETQMRERCAWTMDKIDKTIRDRYIPGQPLQVRVPKTMNAEGIEFVVNEYAKLGWSIRWERSGPGGALYFTLEKANAPDQPGDPGGMALAA